MRGHTEMRGFGSAALPSQDGHEPPEPVGGSAWLCAGTQHRGVQVEGNWGSGEVAVGQAEGVEGRVARVMPEQLLLQEGDGLQGQDQGLVFEHAVYIQAWGWGESQSSWAAYRIWGPFSSSRKQRPPRIPLLETHCGPAWAHGSCRLGSNPGSAVH